METRIAATRYRERERRKEMRKSSRGNPYHDSRGRFTTKDGRGAGYVMVCENGQCVKTENPEETLQEIAEKGFYERRTEDRLLVDLVTELPQEKLKETYDSIGCPWYFSPEENIRVAKEYSVAKAHKDNFYVNSVAEWEEREAPSREPDHVSYDENGEVSSEYWYDKEGVYRKSDHWGSDVASCSWYIKGREYDYEGVEVGERETAFVKWEDIHAKGHVGEKDGEYYLVGFGFSDRPTYRRRRPLLRERKARKSKELSKKTEAIEKEYFSRYKGYLIDGDNEQEGAFYEAETRLRESGYSEEQIRDLRVRLAEDLYGEDERKSEERAIRNLQREESL